MVEQVVQCVFECAGYQLLLQVYREKARAGVDVFVAGHVCASKLVCYFDLDICFGSRHDAGMKRLLLQFRYEQ